MHEMIPKSVIPFNKPFIVGKELFYISQAVLGGKLAGDGLFTKRCNEWLEKKFNARKALLTTSCTTATEMCAILADVGPDDEIIMPSYTFVSTANAFALRGARIRFVDIRPDTMNINEKLIEAAITKRTKAIVPVHYAGVSCEMDTILDIAKRHNLFVIEDAAQGVNATYKGRYLGTLGQLSSYSFHETKNFISGEGGAIIINDAKFIERAEIIREKGTDRSKFFRGEIDKYTWIDIGSSFLPSEIIAAFLYAQLEEADVITRKRWAIFNYYVQQLQPMQDRGFLRLPVCPPECHHNAHMLYIILPTNDDRNRLISFLRDRNIQSVFHYIPLHTSPMGKKMGHKEGDLPVTEDLAHRLLRLPCYFELEKQDQDRVVAAIEEYFQSRK